MSATMAGVGTERFLWSPTAVKIAPGGSVTFTWSGGAVHDVSVPALGFESPGSPKSEGTYTAIFPSPGVYTVICVIHPTMRGQVTVQ